MTREITKTVYKFKELSEEAKEVAREWWRECENADSDTSCTYDDACRMADLLGIEIDDRHWTNSSGFKGKTQTIYYSGFSSQGDGACFEGSYRYKKGAVKAITAETGGTDKELIRIAGELQKIQAKNFYQLTARMKHSGHYYHSGCMSVDVERYDEKEMTSDAEDEITQLMRDFADWIYDQLEADYEYRMSDENVDESITINDYEFYENGEIL